MPRSMLMDEDSYMTSMAPTFKACAICWENTFNTCDMDSEQAIAILCKGSTSIVNVRYGEGKVSLKEWIRFIRGDGNIKRSS